MIKHFFLAFGLFVVVQSWQKCISHSDCKESECCASTFVDVVCFKRPQKGDECDPVAKPLVAYNITLDIHFLGCMCPEGLQCKLGKDLNDKVYRCR
ncbi:U3-aranetoxin-Ce1a-like [Centruroides sculpturatus]|uniref:U3-aranetoxin-Ce1a-like n=1 Tax=Centruroides sculpturatus TaxID=218467 RepID=UPI000C6E1A91|nr:U3-aranetoxin-Ce1a-like [Centruroides sculpturatus]